MSTKADIYCFDANVLIQAWQKYYSPKFCPDYWKILDDLGHKGKIFIPEMVHTEITRTEDDLAIWLKKCRIPVRQIDETVIKALQEIYSKDPAHKNLVDNTKARSLADPWVIAHAICEQATVVTKEEKVTALNSSKIKIPNVCENMKVRWINDFQFVEELDLHFSCEIK